MNPYEDQYKLWEPNVIARRRIRGYFKEKEAIGLCKSFSIYFQSATELSIDLQTTPTIWERIIEPAITQWVDVLWVNWSPETQKYMIARVRPRL